MSKEIPSVRAEGLLICDVEAGSRLHDKAAALVEGLSRELIDTGHLALVAEDRRQRLAKEISQGAKVWHLDPLFIHDLDMVVRADEVA
jgi:hypothetical protein